MHTLLPHRLLTNITILVPNGTTQHGNERILCLPITWNYWPSISAVIVFFAANFLAHAATVKSSPGDNAYVQACNAFLALLFPMSGLLRSLNAILRYSPAQTELDKACHAGALCMVVRDVDWQPEDLANLRVRTSSRLPEEHDNSEPTDADLITYLPLFAREKPSRWIHFDSIWAQAYCLPPGYTFATVPKDTILLPIEGTCVGGDLTNDISASYSILKAVASIIQIVSSSLTLLLHRSDLNSRWGYASYHLCVMPYLIMTLVNLVSNLLIADYPCLYMVWTATMDEAKKSGGEFMGVVARTVTLEDKDDDLVEDLPYCGITNGNIVNFATSFTPSMAVPWQLSVVLHILVLPFYIYEKAKPRNLSISEFMAIDLHISGVQRDLHVEQLSIASDAIPIISNGQPRLSDERDIAAEEQNFEKGPEFRFVEAEDLSRHYRMRICNPPQQSLVHQMGVSEHEPTPHQKSLWGRLKFCCTLLYGVRAMLRSEIDKRTKRSRWSARPEGESKPMALRRKLYLWLQCLGAPRQILDVVRKHHSFAENEPEPATLTTFYYPNCSRFLRMSSPNHITLPTGVASDGSPPTVANERNTRGNLNPHTRCGVLLTVLIGLVIVGIFFGIVGALTHFQPGQSSAIERGVMMAWLASGLYGFCLPFMNTFELLRVFCLLPLVSIIGSAVSSRHERTSYKGNRFKELFRWNRHDMVYQIQWIEPILSFIPLAIFVPPIWGFVLVGRMLVEWGNCTRLY